MNGVSIIENEAVSILLKRLDRIEAFIKEKDSDQKQWMTLKEVCEYMRKSSTWVDLNKGNIGFTKAGGECRFKRSDVDAYLESRYYKAK